MSADGAATIKLAYLNLAQIPEEVLTKCDSIGVLDLTGNRGIDLHGVLGRFKSVKKLVLNDCNIFSLPNDISDITELQELVIQKNYFSDGLNPAVGRLHALKILDLSFCALKSVPDCLGDLESLEQLVLRGNYSIDGLNPAVGRLRAVRKLDLSSCALKSLPDCIGDLEELEELLLGENDFFHGLNPSIGRLHALKKLDLCSCALKSVPDWFGDLEVLEELVLRRNYFSDGLTQAFRQLGALKKLDLGFCALKSFPDFFEDLEALEELVLRGNYSIGSLTPAVGRLRALKKLDVDFCKLKSLPDQIGDLEVLEELFLGDNDFSNGLNPTVGRLHALKKLDLSGCAMESAPDCLGDLEMLEELDLRGNSIGGLTREFDRLRALKKLDLGSCALKSVPDWIGELEVLEELVLRSNDFSHGLNPAVGRLRALRKLDLSSCAVERVPDWLGDLESLEELMLRRNYFSDGLTPAIGRLRAMKKLDLGRCKLKNLPDQFGDLEVLEELVLRQNYFSDGLTPAIGRLRALKTLDLSWCNLKCVPDQLGDLALLSILNLDDNYLEEYPPCLLRLLKLEEFHISNHRRNGNVIKSLPVELAFTRLRKLELDGNPIAEPPKEIWTQGLDAIKSYMRALIPGGELIRADTVNMIGDTGAGKTSIAQSLVERAPRPTEEANRTRVMQQLKMRIDDSSGQSIYINDFGGHEIYHSVMPIFLPTNGLLILVLKMTDQINEERIKKWLLTVIVKSAEIRIIIAGTHADQVTSFEERLAWENQVLKVSKNTLKSAVDEVNTHVIRLKSRHEDNSVDRKLHRLREVHRALKRVDVHVVTLSCFLPDEGLSTLRDLTVSLLRPAQLLPASWCRVIRDMLKQRRDGLGLSIAQVRNIAKLHLASEDDSSIMTLLRYLAKTSQILWVEDHPRLQNFIFLPPQDVIDVCKMVLHHDNKLPSLRLFYKEALEEYEKGILQESLLRALLERPEEDVNHIEDHDIPVFPAFEVIVDFLTQFNLVSHVQRRADSHRFVIPCKLPRDEPSEFMEYNKTGGTCLNRVIVRLSFIGSLVPLSFFETSLSSMLTLAGAKFEYSKIVIWKDGCIIIHDGVYFLAKLGNDCITLIAYSTPDAASPWSVLQPVLRRLNDDVVGTWHGAPPSCSIPCPWCSRCCSQGGDLESNVGQIIIDMSKLAAPERCDNPRPTCPKCTKAIPQSLCFPTASLGSNTEDQRNIMQFFECNDGGGGNPKSNELVRRLRKARPQLVDGLNRHAVARIVDALIAARDGEGLITDDNCQEIEAESTDNGKVRKLLHIVGTGGDEAIKTLAETLKCKNVLRPDLAKLILEPPL